MIDVPEYIKHLRHAHLAMVLASVSLLIVAEVDQSADRRVARSNLAQLQQALATWDSLNLWDAVSEAAADTEAFKGMKERPGSLGGGTCTPSFSLVKNTHCVVVDVLASVKYGGKEYPVNTRVEIVVPPAYVPPEVNLRASLADLGQIRRFWDSLLTPLLVVGKVDTDKVTIEYSLSDDHSAAHIVSELEELVRQGAFVQVESAVSLKDRQGYIEGSDHPVVRGDRPRAVLLLEAKVNVPILLVEEGPKTFHELDERLSKFPHFSFARSFPELNRLTAGYPESIYLDALDQILEKESDRDAEKFSAAGLSMPREVVLLLGLPLLLGIQLYFLVSLQAFGDAISSRDERPANPPVPWLGLYRGSLPGFLYVAVSAGLPVTCVLRLLFRSKAAGDQWQFVLASGVAIAIGVTAFLTAVRGLQLRGSRMPWERASTSE